MLGVGVIARSVAKVVDMGMGPRGRQGGTAPASPLSRATRNVAAWLAGWLLLALLAAS